MKTYNESAVNENVNPVNVEKIIEKFNLYWSVKKEPLTLPDGSETPFFATVRQDNRTPFASVKGGYEVFQNWELAELVMRTSEILGSNIDRGGMFDGGGKVYLQIKQESVGLENNDRIDRWWTAINSFDGSGSLKWGGTNVTISCNNSFWAAYRGLNTSIRHTANMRQLVERSLKVIESIEEADRQLIQVFTDFQNESVEQDQVKKVIEMITRVDVTKRQSEAEKEYSTRALNNAKDLTQSIVSEMSYKGRTLWGLWSGVTHFTTHKAGSDSHREKSKAVGSLARIDQEVFDLLKEMVYA